MIPELRRAYNQAFSPEKYDLYKRRLEERAGGEIPFRLAESPVFLPPELRDAMVSASLEIFEQLTTSAALWRSESAVPQEFNVPGSDPLPTFAVTDFAVTRGSNATLIPKSPRTPIPRTAPRPQTAPTT